MDDAPRKAHPRPVSLIISCPIPGTTKAEVQTAASTRMAMILFIIYCIKYVKPMRSVLLLGFRGVFS